MIASHEPDRDAAASTGRCLAIFGTASDVGKSLVATAVCRVLSDAGLSVAPFKAQNMSNNSYVALDGGEVGRAQYVQAVAARCEPSVHHNPVLLKPAADDSSQVVLHGQALGTTTAREYFADNSALRVAAYASLDRLRRRHDAVVLEGAGSCAEVNLRSREFVNFPAAHHADAKVILVADIDRGGVFAQVVGSLEVMPEQDRARVAGIIVNKFRGDARLFDDGVLYLEQRTKLPVLGVLPFSYDTQLDSEDALPLALAVDPPPGADASKVCVAVLRLPHISNFTDFDALSRVPGVAVHYIYRPRDLSQYRAVILPGSKSVRADLAWLRETGLAQKLVEYHARGGRLLGLCGGFQMLGRSIADPEGLEGLPGQSEGLGLIKVNTALGLPKIVRRVAGRLADNAGEVSGYEIHVGRSDVDGQPPLLELSLAAGLVPDGVRLEGVWGSYLHGLFDEPAFLCAFLRWVCPELSWPSEFGPNREAWLNQQVDAFTEHFRRHVDWRRLVDWCH